MNFLQTLPEFHYWITGIAGATGAAFTISLLREVYDIQANSFKLIYFCINILLILFIGITWYGEACQQKEAAPRILTERQQQQIISILSPCAKKNPPSIFIIENSSDPEAWKYAKYWASVLYSSGWKAWTIEKPSTIRGIYIEAQKNNVRGIKSLQKAFESVGVKIPVIVNKELPEDDISLFIGGKENSY